MRRASGITRDAGNVSARAASAAPSSTAARAATGQSVRAGAIGQQITVAVNTTFNTLFTELGGVRANPISGLLEGALVLVRRTVFGLVPSGVTATVSGSTLMINVDSGSTAYFRQTGGSLQVSGDPVFFHLFNQQQFSASSVQAVQATGTGHAGFVFTTGDVAASLETTGIDSLNFGADALFDRTVDATLTTGTLVLYKAVRGKTGVTLDAPAIRLATDVSVEASNDPGDPAFIPNVTFTGTVDATTAGAQSLTVTALGITTFEGAVGSRTPLGSILTQGITPLDIPQIAGTSQTIPLSYAPLYSATGIAKVAHGILVAIGNNAPQFYTFDAGGDGFTAGYNQTLWNGVPLVGPPESTSFESGGIFNGPGVTTPITIGVGANSITTRPIQLLAGVSNTQGTQPLDFTSPYIGVFNTRFFGDFGVSFANNSNNSAAPLSSAMWQLPGNLGNGFLVQLGPMGNTNQVTVGPTPALIEQFPFAISVPQAVPSSTYPGTDNPVLQKGPVGDYTVVINGEPTHYPGIFNIFDTGTGDTTFYVSQPPHGGAVPAHDGDSIQFPPGSEVSATFANALPSGEALTWSFTVGTTPSVDRAFYTVEDPSTYQKSLPNVVPGLNLYNDFDVLFDAQKQLIYLRPNGGQSTVSLESVTTTGAQSYQQGNVTLDGTYTTSGGDFSVAGTTTLNGDTTTVNAGAGDVRFSGTVDGVEAGANALVVNTSGATTFVREVGVSSALSSVSVTGGGATATAAVTTYGSQSYGGDALLNGPYWVYDTGSAFTVAGATTLVGPVSVNTCGTATGEPSCVGRGANITFFGPVDSFTGKGFPLTVAAGDNGVVTFNGAVGAGDPLGGLAISNADTVTARGVVSLNGGLGYSAAVGLQFGNAGDGGRVRAANFIAGGSVLGFQVNGGPNFGATNGSGNQVGCNDSTTGACGTGVVVQNGSQLAIQGFTIANNASNGVLIANSSDVTITRNNILANAGDGVGVTGTSTNNDISSNTISGNTGSGVNLAAGSNGNTILSNTIKGNTVNGVSLDGSSNNTISNNTISGNTSDGVTVTGASVGNTFTNNTINANTANGVTLDGSSLNTFTNNTISGNGCACASPDPGTGDGVAVTGASAGNTFTNNTISGNTVDGVGVSGSGAVGNAILSNSIFSNTAAGIALIDGGNDGQVAPTGVTAALQSGNVLVSGTVGGSGNYTVQVFANPTNTVGDGETFLGSFTVAAGAFTNESVSAGTTTSGYITTTVTPLSDPRNTSEFSAPVELTVG
jgi:parallel beta-helix repeat protein